MGYLGNSLGVAFSSYKLIDSLTASFNGTTTSFALTVNGVTPVPFPLNEQNILLSVGGVPQKPDSTGTEGFRFSGSNIVFSSAPKTGEAFWGVILAGADRVNAGVQYPDGTASVPSISFASQTTTGFYRSGSGQIGVGINGSTPVAFSTSGVQLNGLTSGSVIIASPAVAGNNTLTLPTSNGSANQFLKNGATAGSLGWSSLVEDSSGRLLVGTSTNTNNIRIGQKIASVATGGTDYGGLSLTTYAGTSFAVRPVLDFQRSRGTTDGSLTAVLSGDFLGTIVFRGSDGTNFIDGAYISGEVDGGVSTADLPTRLVFSTTADGAASPTERMRITNAGEVKINEFTSSGVGLSVREINTGSVVINADSTRAQNTTWYSFYGTSSSATVLQSYIRGDGAYGSRTSVYGGTSDIKLKENIEPAGSQWSDIKCLQIKKFNFIGDGLRQIGVIAQEVEEVSPGLVDENIDRDSKGNDLGTVTKSVKYSILYMKAVKALQEAMERIEQLEQRLTDAGIA